MFNSRWVILTVLLSLAGSPAACRAAGEVRSTSPRSSRDASAPKESGAEVRFVGNRALPSSVLRSLLDSCGALALLRTPAGGWSSEAGPQGSVRAGADGRRQAGSPAVVDGDTVATACGGGLESVELAGRIEGGLEAAAFERARDALLDAYRGTGYFQASVDSIVIVPWGSREKVAVPGAGSTPRGGPDRAQRDRDEKVVVYITEGRPAAVGSVRFSGNSAVSSRALSRACGIEPGSELVEGVIERASDKLVDYLTDHGLPFASVSVGEFREDEAGVSFCFFVSEGPLCKIGGVRLQNSGALSQRALQRALRMRPGELYSESELRNGLTLLRRSGLFSDVGEPAVHRSGGDSVSVSIPVEERKTTSIEGALGFRGRTNEVTGGLSLSMMNLARSGRSARASWDASGRQTSTLRFMYSEPWTTWLPFSSNVSFEHTARDTFFARTSLSVLARVPVWHWFTGRGGASFEKTLTAGPERSRTSRAAWLAGGEVFLGEPSWLGKNTFFTWLELSRGERKRVLLSSGEGEARSFSTLTGECLLQRRILGSHICVTRIHASGVLEGAELLVGDELFALGGTKTLRGYSERQFLAATVGSAQFEYGLVVGGEGGRAFVFADLGYASAPASRRLDRMHLGYGIGLRIPSPLGLAGLDLGIPAGESLGSAKVHVGLEGRL